MSTRAHIRIIDGKEQIQLYHHFDGYPEGVGADLKEFLEKKNIWNGEIIANELIKSKEDDGYEVTTCLHGDEEYIYVIDCKAKSLKCYSHGWDESYNDSIVPENERTIPD